MATTPPLLRQSLFRKYFIVLFAAVVLPLLLKSLGDAWFGYRDQRSMVDALLRVEASAAANKIGSFLDDITSQLGSAFQQPWTAGSEAPIPAPDCHSHRRRARKACYSVQRDGRGA